MSGDHLAERADTTHAAFEFILEGVGRMEEIPLREVADFLESIVILVAQGAASVMGRPIRGSGQYPGPVADAARVRLVALRSGSLRAELLPAAPAPQPEGLGIAAVGLSEAAIEAVVTTIDGSDRYPELAGSLATFIERHRAHGHDASLRIIDLRHGGSRDVVADAASLPALLAVAARGTLPTMASRLVSGRMFEADVERRTAKVRTASGAKVDVSFGPEHVEAIERVFGATASLSGDVDYDPSTAAIRRIRVTEVVAGEQMGLDFGGVDFFHPPTLAELSARQGTGPVTDPDALALQGVSDADWDAFFEAIGVAV